jgi:putative transcriptional regulator
MPGELGGCEIFPGIYWGGSFDVLRDMITNTSLNIADVKLFAGYAGWSVGQLDKEMDQDSWYVGSINSKLLFDTDMSDIWRKAILELGDGFAPLVNMPLNPQFN